MKWKSAITSSLKTIQDAEKFFGCPLPATPFKIFIPLPLAREIKRLGLDSPLGKQYLPSVEENNTNGMADPIGDDAHRVTPHLIHRYKNRALFLPIKSCPIICRFCFRKNLLNGLGNDTPTAPFQETLNYLQQHSEINEIIFSGGDPFYLPDTKLYQYLEAFSQIPHIKYIRFHTRVPLVLPSRITSELIATLKSFSFKRLVINIHTNHSSEFFGEATEAFTQLCRHFEVKTQTVLLKGINNHLQTLTELFLQIIDLGATPYYLHHPDLVKGGQHFYLPIEEGRKLYHQLRDELPGWAIPHYVLDFPGGGGKIPLFNPEQYKFDGKIVTLNGEFKNYPTFFFD